MTNNFQCKSCDQVFFIPAYTFKFDDSNKQIFFHKSTGQRITCIRCKSENIKFIEKPGDFTTVNLGKYTMKSVEQRQEHLKKRSHEHFKREIKDKKRQIDQNPNLQSL